MDDIRKHLLSRVFPNLALTMRQRAELADIALRMSRENMQNEAKQGLLDLEAAGANREPPSVVAQLKRTSGHHDRPQRRIAH